ncbi:MAG: hypothetical protein ACJ77L_05035 [Solirubrobacteraceae bacterium]
MSGRSNAPTESRRSPTTVIRYLFTGDNAPGATNGQGVTAFGAQWFVVSPAGNQVSGKVDWGPQQRLLPPRVAV